LKNGVFWYRDEPTYLRFRDIIEDNHQIAMPYQEWVIKSQQFIDDKAKQGVFIIKINAEPDEFVRWCEINCAKPDYRARMAFAMEKVNSIIGSG